jgi:mediator of RNA polymerase II transcription subunit 5
MTNIKSTDSVLLLFGSYPGDPALQAYLRTAVREGVLSVATLVSTFLQAARSLTLQSPATLDLLCKVALETHYMSRMPPIGSLVPFAELPVNVLGTIHDAILLLKIAYTLPPSDFHQLTLTASNLVLLLLSCASDFSQLSTTQAMTYFTDTTDLLQIARIPLELRQGLESFALSLISVLGDDAKVARETQMMHSIQIPLGNNIDASGPTSENDTVTFSLFFHNLVRLFSTLNILAP